MKQKIYNTLPLIILLLVLLATYFVWRSAVNMTDMQRKERFEGKVQLVEAAIRERLAIYSDAQYAGAGLFLSSDLVTRNDWREFIRAFHLLKRYPGINGMGYAVPVKKEDAAKFVRLTRLDGAPDFRITSFEKEPANDEFFVIKYIEPYEVNKPALGFDMGSEPRRRKAMEDARDLGKPVITSLINLVQDSTKSPGFLMYVPFYKYGHVPVTVEERRANFLGWVYAPFLAKDFMEAIRRISLTDSRNLIHIEVFDEKPLTRKTLLYETTDTKKAKKLRPVIKEISLYNNSWTLRISPTPELAKLYSHRRYWLIWFGGGLLSLSLYYVVYLLSSTRRHAMEIAKNMTVEIRRQKEQMQQKNVELERSNRDLEQFAYVASHDLKEPLRMVNIYTQLLANRYNDKLDDEARTYIRFATEGAARMGSLINDLLLYARLGNELIEKTIVDVEVVLQHVKQALQIQIQESNAQIKTLSPLPKVIASEHHIHSLFQNLISNSLKYHKRNETPVISINAERFNVFWLFSIADNGIGMEKEHLEKIFIIFQRLHQKDEYTGTGIGLAVCKKIVEFHGGKIWAESTPGKGTTIFFTLPALVKEE
ncbi:MAG: CHASE domain-containing protein [Bacteroidia bacterium]